MSEVANNSGDGLVAPEGQEWVCCACGKTAEHKYGNWGGYKASRGWDESCMLNAVLRDKAKGKSND